MPVITVEGPAIEDLDRKREFARELTDAATKAFGFPKETIVVLMKDNRPENVSVGGELIIDRNPIQKGSE